MAERDFLNGVAGGEAEGKTGAHYAGKCCDEDSRFQIEFLDGGALLLFGHFAFFGDACRAGDEDAEEADADADENGEAGACTPDVGEKLATENGRHQSAEGCGVAENHGHAERHAEIAHGEAEGEAAETPQETEEIGPEEAARRGFAQDLD